MTPDRETADKYFDMCQKIADQSKDSNVIMEVLFIDGVMDRNMAEYESARDKILKVIDFSERKKDTTNIDRIHLKVIID